MYGIKRNPYEYRLHRFEHVPGHELGRVARVLEVMNTAPRGELDPEDWTVTPEVVASHQAAAEATGAKRLLYTAEHLASAKFVAFSEVKWHPLRAGLIDQQGTAVHSGHRGRGLARWLKAAVLLDLPAANPLGRKLYTSNADGNAAMLGINRALGFVPAFCRTVWQGETQALLTASTRD